MSRLLRIFIKEALEEVRGNPNVKDQLVTADGEPESGEHPSDENKDTKYDAEGNECDEMSTVATSLTPGGGYTAPFGAKKKKKQKFGWK